MTEDRIIEMVVLLSTWGAMLVLVCVVLTSKTLSAIERVFFILLLLFFLPLKTIADDEGADASSGPAIESHERESGTGDDLTKGENL